MSEPIISLKHVSKSYRKYDNNRRKLRQELLGRNTGRAALALDDISLDIYPGETVTVMGKKGAGVSTLLRIIAGIITPDEGVVAVNGKVETYFVHRQLFDSSLSGHENMSILASVHGISQEALEEHEAEIMEFAGAPGMEKEPMGTYPAGAATRIGFALLTSVKPDIMLFDETFKFGGTGATDACRRRLHNLTKGEDTTLIMNMTKLTISKKLCTRGIVLDHGKLVFDGEISEAYRYYKENYKTFGGEGDSLADSEGDDSGDANAPERGGEHADAEQNNAGMDNPEYDVDM